MDRLREKVILITGAAGNLGGAVAKRAIEAGAKVSLTDMAREALISDFRESDHVMVGMGADISEIDACRALIAQTRANFGSIDGVISTVGGFAFAHVVDDTYTTWEHMLTMNLKTAFHLAKASAEAMKEQGSGSIVLTGATAALKAPSGVPAYAAAKSGVMRLAESLAEELKPTGVRVNCVMPSIIDTPQNREAMPDANIGSWVTPDAIAEVMLFLVSDGARAVSCALVPVTGKD